MPKKQTFDDFVVPEPNSGCSLFGGTLCSSGYGMYRVGKRMEYAHRLAWQRLHGPIPSGMRVLHLCDTRACCNPQHLFLGTHRENMRDMVLKNRQARGERAPRSKLREAHVAEILASDLGSKALSEVFGVSTATIRHIRAGKTWKHMWQGMQGSGAYA